MPNALKNVLPKNRYFPQDPCPDQCSDVGDEEKERHANKEAEVHDGNMQEFVAKIQEHGVDQINAKAKRA